MKNTIKSHQDFDFGKEPLRASMPAFIMLGQPKKKEKARYGLVVAKKHFKFAVTRNRAKRLIREWIYQNKLPDDLDIIIIAKTTIFESKDGAIQVKKAIKKITSPHTDSLPS